MWFSSTHPPIPPSKKQKECEEMKSTTGTNRTKNMFFTTESRAVQGENEPKMLFMALW